MNALIKPETVNALAAATNGRMAVSDIIQHVAVVQEVMRAVMKPDVHYGKIPGTDKPTLYKAGAEVLCMVFRIADTYEVTDECNRAVKVEEILKAAETMKKEKKFQEDITQELARVLGAKVTTTGYHSGVKTICECS